MLAFTHGSALVAAATTATTLLLASSAPQTALAAPAPVAGSAMFNSLFGRSHHHNDDDDDDDNSVGDASKKAHKFLHKLKLFKYDPRRRHHKISRDDLEAWALNDRRRIVNHHHRHVRISKKAKTKRERKHHDDDDDDDDDDDEGSDDEDDDDDDDVVDEDTLDNQRRSIDEAIEARTTSTIGSQGLDQFYYAQVDVGTPAQAMNVYLDTGSADLWIIGKNCHGKYSDYCKQVPLLDTSKSTTYKSDRSNQSNYQTVSYVDGSGFSGWLGSDTVSFAGYTLPDVKFITVDDLESDPNQQPTSGLMGLSYQAESVSKSKPFLQTLADDKKFTPSANGFGLALTRQPRNKTTTQNGYDGTAPGGIIDIGEIDPTSYSGQLNFVDIPEAVQKDGSWAIPIDDVTVDGKSIAPSLADSDKNTAYIDSGTSLFYQPSSINKAFFDTVDGAEALKDDMKGYYSMPCDAKPNLALTFGGISYKFNYEDLNAGALDDNGETCLAAISDSDGSGVDFLVGATFHKSYYIFYSFGIDGRGPQIGFANLPVTGAPTTATGPGAHTPTATVSSGAAAASATTGSSKIHPQNSYASAAATGSPFGNHDNAAAVFSANGRTGLLALAASFLVGGAMVLI